ncbi:hypothetical protein [Acidihalobacter prosperus]|uniref:hypothetical protein n=1 Tax=Acidihalobacter prosperus TaxID=160660 RepID=UPI0011AB329A|nr:hypothetical protein [Acidihalobacter prosperus]
MKLNQEQARHLADTFRIVAVAQFGFFGYHGLVEWNTHGFTLLWSTAVFIVSEWLAVRLLKENVDGTR